MRKSAFLYVCIVVLAAFALAACAEQGGGDEVARLQSEIDRLRSELGEEAGEAVHVGVSIPSADHGWTGGVVWNVQRAVNDWQTRDANVSFTVQTAANPEQQVGDVEDLLVQGIDALVLLPHDSASLTPIAQEVVDRGIELIIVDRGLTADFDYHLIAGDNPGLGRVSAEWMAEQMNYRGNIVAFEGLPVVINTERVEAFEAVMAQYPDITILDSQLANWSTQRGLEIMEDYLQRFPEIDAVFAQDDDVLMGVLQAYRESGRDDIQLMMGGAGSKPVMEMIRDGDELVRATVTYSPTMAASAVTLGVMAARGDNFDGLYQVQLPERVILRAELVDASNVEDYYEADSVY